MTVAANIEEYIHQFPSDVQLKLQEIRRVIQETAPEATEDIRYAIPTFRLNGNLVHFAAFRRHIGFYPGAEAIALFNSELSKYHHAKGSVQFPIDGPMPLELVRRITLFRVQKNRQKKLK